MHLLWMFFADLSYLNSLANSRACAVLIKQFDGGSVGDPDPQDPHIIGFPVPDPFVRGMDPDPDPSPFLLKVLSGLI
jgi:hypothetical protein